MLLPIIYDIRIQIRKFSIRLLLIFSNSNSHFNFGKLLSLLSVSGFTLICIKVVAATNSIKLKINITSSTYRTLIRLHLYCHRALPTYTQMPTRQYNCIFQSRVTYHTFLPIITIIFLSITHHYSSLVQGFESIPKTSFSS